MHKSKTTLPLGKLAPNLLNELITQLPTRDPDLIVPPGVGKDAAGLKIGRRLFALTTDPITLTGTNIGQYSIAVNVNDIACMGCKPRWFLATMMLPPTATEKELRHIWQDLANALKQYDITSIGGHVEVTAAVNTPVIVGEMIGEAIDKRLLDIGTAQPGDKILLWQPVAIEGTALLAQDRAKQLTQHFTATKLDTMQQLLHNPGICVWPLVKKIVPTKGLVGLHDPTEGGIATAINEIADACNCGFNVDRQQIPVRSDTAKLAQLLDFDPLGLLASGSLLIICRPKAVEKIRRKLSNEALHLIGELTANQSQRTLPRFASDEIIKALTSISTHQ